MQYGVIYVLAVAPYCQLDHQGLKCKDIILSPSYSSPLAKEPKYRLNAP